MSNTKIVTLDDIDRVLINLYGMAEWGANHMDDSGFLKFVANEIGVSISQLLHGLYSSADGKHAVNFGNVQALAIYGRGVVEKNNTIREIDKKIATNITRMQIRESTADTDTDKALDWHTYEDPEDALRTAEDIERKRRDVVLQLEAGNRALEWVKGLLQKPQEGDMK